MLMAWSMKIPNPSIADQSAPSRKPNFLIAFADDWGRFASIYASIDRHPELQRLVRTPNFDRIAARGVLFRSAFVSAPSCTPCRSALLSGQHFWRTGQGAILQGAVWDPSIPSFPHLLQDAGYCIGETFKVWSPGKPGDAPFGGGKFAFEKTGGRFNQFSESLTKELRQGGNVESLKKKLVDLAVANFDSFLQSCPDKKPFCYWFGPTNVHRKWVRGSGKELWGYDPDEFQGKLPPFLPDVPEVREDLADYFGEIAAWDMALGGLLEKLEQAGELESTWIIVSGDHGPPGFPHGKCNLYDFGASVSLAICGPGLPGGRVCDDLISLTDIAPTLLEASGIDRPETMTGKSLVSLLQSHQSGRIEPQRDAVFIGRERHVESARADYSPYPQRAIRTHDFLYIFNFKPERWPLGDPYRLDGDNPPTNTEVTETTRVTLPDEDAGPTKAWMVAHRNDPTWKSTFERAYGKRPREELYDLLRDPYQMTNVATDPLYAADREGLEKRLMDELNRTGDPRVINDGHYFENPPLSGPVSGTTE
ncbi:MAG: sulfatase [Planctomycetes bacterium]|nr:sulfatase [Planctomycetota bacterium]